MNCGYGSSDSVKAPIISFKVSNLKNQFGIPDHSRLSDQYMLHVTWSSCTWGKFPRMFRDTEGAPDQIESARRMRKRCESKHSFLQSQCCYLSKIPVKSTEVRASKIRPIRLNYCTLPRVSEKFNYTSIILRVKPRPCYITNILLSIFV
jgi:hypothetical protein